MTRRPSPSRRMALALMGHAAWVLPSARGPWARAMQHELSQIGNDLEALTWAGGCVVASYVERGRATTRQQKRIGLAAFPSILAIAAASWWAGQRPYLTPGNHQVFHQDSNTAALAGFLIFIAATVGGGSALMRRINDRKWHEAVRAGRFCAAIVVAYLAVLVLISLLTPRTVVNIGDSYCYDLWCVGVDHVNATQKGQDVLYTADVRIFVDSSHPHHLPTEQAKDFFYVLDDQGGRYPLLQEASFLDADVTVQPGESVKSSVAFLAPPKARKFYLIGNSGQVFPPWVYLSFGSDVSLIHGPTLLRLL